MSISYRFAKMNASAIEVSQKFNQCIAPKKFEYSSLATLNAGQTKKSLSHGKNGQSTKA
ncbi:MULTISPECIES: hypothetical protein [unclassified Pseudoalteromonas]|uniref:hypothetical protein n=1 Tax=unclassified Pseudoalteromonas TaxID=194690 RepID=UPI0018F51AEC|nr:MULTISPECIES: hypothetical protein [unclassified Pseudoalteromonas]MCF2917749.1 hypothetical protein [Pseudoalteromonas sp. Cn5-37]